MMGKCDHDGCENDAEKFTFDNGNSVFVCLMHVADDYGFCPKCKKFFAGDDQDELSVNLVGLCYQCACKLRLKNPYKHTDITVILHDIPVEGVDELFEFVEDIKEFYTARRNYKPRNFKRVKEITIKIEGGDSDGMEADE